MKPPMRAAGRAPLAWALVALCCGLLLASRCLVLLRLNALPTGDQGANLSIAARLSESGGWLGFLRSCATGSYREANRHPLLPLLLAPAAGRDPGFFVRAKRISLGLSWAALAAFLVLLGRERGWRTAAAAGAWLAACPGIAEHCASVGPEVVLAAMAGVCWLLADARSARGAWACGLAAGVAYMAKGPGLLAAACVFGGAAWAGVPRRQTARMCGGFLLASAPLLLRNTVAYGSPFYNLNSHLLWLDSAWEYWPSSWSGMLASTGPGDYLARHSAWDALARWAVGLWRTLATALASWSPAGAAGSLLLLLAAARGMGGSSAAHRRAAALMGIAFLSAFAWFAAVGVYPRYLYPLLFVAAAWAGEHAAAAWSGLGPKPLWAGAAALSLLAASASVSALRAAPARPAGLERPEVMEAVRWLDEKVSDGSRLVMDSDDYFLWMLRREPLKACLPLPARQVWGFASWGKADYVVFSRSEPGSPPAGYARGFSNAAFRIFKRTAGGA